MQVRTQSNATLVRSSQRKVEGGDGCRLRRSRWPVVAAFVGLVEE